MRALRVNCLPALLFMCCSIFQGQDLTTLNGNWHLTGSWDYHPNDVRLFLSLGVQGDEIFGSGDIWTSCEGGGVVPLRGRISSDGTFVLHTNYGIPKWERKISISGTVPEAPSAQWSGRFVVGQTKKKCPAQVAGDFVATPITRLNGFYSGTLLSADRTPVTVTVNISQGELVTFEDSPGHVLGALPLHATMTLAGPLFSSETLTADAAQPSCSPCSSMTGDIWVLLFPVGSEFHVRLEGNVTEPTLNKLRATLSYPGKDFAAGGFLTRR
jgi:hypothetical protein